MTRNNKKYKCFTSCNNDNGEWGLHWEDGHEDWKNKQGNKSYVGFSNPNNNAIIYLSYFMITTEKSTEEEEKCGYDSQNNDFIYLSCFELLK